MEKGLHGGLGASVRVGTWLAHTEYMCPAPVYLWAPSHSCCVSPEPSRDNERISFYIQRLYMEP